MKVSIKDLYNFSKAYDGFSLASFKEIAEHITYLLHKDWYLYSQAGQTVSI